ncbi:MAG TPA: phenylalanine--tRNA ligase subunit alpha [Bacteroidetes bacterium]|nr:phenylalanine--tRNA ligase subunit alpha [Bacteroidota bacterium]
MKELIRKYLQEASRFEATGPDELEAYRIKYLGKKGIIPELFSRFRNLDPSEKKETGKLINELKELVSNRVREQKEKLETTHSQSSAIDLSLPGEPYQLGSRHPVSIVKNEMIGILQRMGFTIAEGPDIEDDWHNFTALNFPLEHPARDMQDTFFIEKNPDILLRTHTSGVQVRVMEQNEPPIRIIAPGRVFRNEAISARAHCIFHQIEGLYIDRDVSWADLRQALLYFSKEMFGKDTQIRLRPSFFPFTEPSAELDISCMICGGKGCPVCKYSGWVEILGCGMVDPNVLASCHIDPKMYSGYAFGMGIERTALNIYQIHDLRLFFENDIRFLNQFKSAI